MDERERKQESEKDGEGEREKGDERTGERVCVCVCVCGGGAICRLKQSFNIVFNSSGEVNRVWGRNISLDR